MRTLQQGNMADDCVLGVLQTFDLQPKNNNFLPTSELKGKADEKTNQEFTVNETDIPSKVEKITKLNGFSKPIAAPSNSALRAVLRSGLDKKQAVQNLELNKQLHDEEW